MGIITKIPHKKQARDKLQFWKTDLLAQRLKRNEVPEKEKLIYFLATAVVFTLLGSFSSENFGFTLALLDMALVTWGYLWVFSINSGGDNKYFLDRVVSLGWPLSIKVILILLPLVVLNTNIFKVLFSINLTEGPQEKISMGAYIIIFNIIYFLRLAHWVRYISKS